MIRTYPGLNKLGQSIPANEVNPGMSSTNDLTKYNVTPFILQAPSKAPRSMNHIRPSTMIPLGKANQNSIELGHGYAESQNTYQPNFGNFRNQPRGLLSNKKWETKTKLMPRPASDFAFLSSKLKQPK